MKTLLTILLAHLLLAANSFAVTWDYVAISGNVKQGGSRLTTVALSTASYLNFVSVRDTISKRDLFVGFREDTGEVAVVQISTKTVRYNIVSALTAPGGTAVNGTNTTGSISENATVSSLNTDFAGYIYDTFTRAATGKLTTVTRTAIGGSGTQTIKLSIHTTGRKINL